jgi:dolichyl-phosphate beta-glucosyltransferase
MHDFTEIKNDVEISIIIPVYNGSVLLDKHLTPFLYYLRTKSYNSEVILVDDGSIDQNITKNYADNHGLIFLANETNEGKGSALRKGFWEANGRIQIFTDADVPFQYANFDVLVDLLTNNLNQFVIGDRTHPDSTYFESSSSVRKLGSMLVSSIVNSFFFKEIKDTQCGLKGMSIRTAKKLFSLSFINRFAIDIELIFLCKKFEIPIRKFPVQLRYNDISSVDVLNDGVRLLYDIVRIRRHHNRKRMHFRRGDKVAINGDYQYNAYYYGSLPQQYWNRFKFLAAIENLNIDEAKQILDVGCGSAMLCSIIAKKNPVIQVTGIDENAEAISFCKTKWKDFANLRFVQSRVDDLAVFKDGSVDRIAFLEVIEHITKIQSNYVLGEFSRILRKSGILVISTPNRKSLWPIIEHVLDLLKLTPRLKGEQHEVLYSGKELAKIAKDQGFILKRKQTINFMAPWVAFISKKWAGKIHAWESKRGWLPGSLLLYTFIKNND